MGKSPTSRPRWKSAHERGNNLEEGTWTTAIIAQADGGRHVQESIVRNRFWLNCLCGEADITAIVGALQTTCGTCHTLTRVSGPSELPWFPPPRPTRPLALPRYGANQGIPNMAKVAEGTWTRQLPQPDGDQGDKLTNKFACRTRAAALAVIRLPVP